MEQQKYINKDCIFLKTFFNIKQTIQNLIFLIIMYAHMKIYINQDLICDKNIVFLKMKSLYEIYKIIYELFFFTFMTNI